MTPLRAVPLGHTVPLGRPQGHRLLRRRMAELGFVRGALVSVLSRGAHGSVLVAVGDTRVALDAEAADALVVELASPTAGPAAAPVAPGRA